MNKIKEKTFPRPPKKASSFLISAFRKLHGSFGPQHWWPGDTPFEVAVGAILTQNTNWSNVEKAIKNLKKEGILGAKAMHEVPLGRLAPVIRPAGYFNIKAGRLKEFVSFLTREYGGSMKRLGQEEEKNLRIKLLAIKGIGPETADSIMLYALDKPVFVIDAYTKRILSRHGVMDYKESYDRFQKLFHDRFGNETSIKDLLAFYNEYHALFVMTGKTYCKKKPLCDICPLNGM